MSERRVHALLAMRAIFVYLFAFLTVTSSYRQWRNIYQKITREPEYSGFNLMIKNHRIAKLNLNYAAMTVFVPENQAVDAFDGEFTDHLVLYHMGFEVKTLELLGENISMPTAHADDPPLWITMNERGFYINNAKILDNRSNYVARSQGDQSKNQVLHVIDQVLDPMVHTPYPNASAYTFLSHYYKWKIGDRTVQEFFHRVQHHKREHLYQQPGGHTFFIPIDHRMDDYELENIDGYIIDGHVVPNVVLFTRPSDKNFVHETAANGDYVYIVMSLHNTSDRHYVKSYTVLGNSAHKKGEVMAEIVKSDIPVANGVVHLIKQPLAVFKRELKPFPYLSVFYKLSADPYLSQSYDFGRRAGFNKVLKDQSLFVTYFAPRNRAWASFLPYGPDRLVDIIGRHVILSDSRITLTKLAMLAKNGTAVSLNSLSGEIKLALNQSGGVDSLVWNGKRITIYRADYECTNGVVHVVDDLFADLEPLSATTASYGFWKALKKFVS